MPAFRIAGGLLLFSISFEMMAGLIGVLAVVIVVSWLCLSIADRVNRLLGTLGNVVVSRLLGIVLAALAVQFVIDGIRAAVRA